jgi:hypothetical protein
MEGIKIPYLSVGFITALITVILTFDVLGHAGETDESTEMTFSAPVQIPGNKVLPAGTYLFKLADSDFDRGLVQIFNANGTRLYATVLTIPTDRREPTGETEVTLTEPGAAGPAALLNWFYPGRLTGHEFVYSKHEEEGLAQYREQTVAGNPQTAPGPKTGSGFLRWLFHPGYQLFDFNSD